MKQANLEPKRDVFVDKLNFIKFKLPVLLVLLGMLFVNIPGGLAQSVQEWSDPINLSMSGAASNPSMVVDGNGVIHVIWADAFDGFKYSQSTDGLTWTAPVTIKYPFSTKAAPPVMFTDAKGVIHIFWQDEQHKLFYAQTAPENLDSPSGWRTKTTIDSSVYDFDAAMDPQGRMHVTYLKNPAPPVGTTVVNPVPVTGTAGVFYRRSADGGRSWAAPSQLYESSYFRSLAAETAHVRMAVSDNPEDEHVYAVWDDRPQKRIFMAISPDGGLTWGPGKELIAPDTKLGFRTPSNADIDVRNDKLLVTWFVGDVGGRCIPYSWSSSDQGETWGEQTQILSELVRCPEKSQFIDLEADYSVDLFTIQGNLSLNAWNGNEWSDTELQTGPSSITNPATIEPVLLGCKQVAIHEDRLFVVGCDQGEGKDIWFLERKLEPWENLFPQPSDWSGDTSVITAPRTLSSLSSVADRNGNIHAVWVQSPVSQKDKFSPAIQYARWNGKEWTRPIKVLTDVDHSPQNLSLLVDNQQRLLLAWVNQNTGELMFTSVNSESANLPIEWNPPVILSASSKLTNSLSMLVDGSDRIVIAYAIMLNESRGIYLIQSTDAGKTWSSPVKVFDAVAEGWEMVDQPKLAVTEDGTLHILFTKYSFLGESHPIGLYYSQSQDGGVTWTPAETVSEQPVQWSEMVASQGVLHRFWPEKNGSIAWTNHQISSDSGKTWGQPNKIPGDVDVDSIPDVSVDGAGNLHFVQVMGQDKQIFEEWDWTGTRWQLFETRKLASLELNSPPRIESNITSNGELQALIQFEELLENGTEMSIRSINRSLKIAEPVSSSLAVISTPSESFTPVATSDLQPTPTSTLTLANLPDTQSKPNKNAVGLVLVILIVSFLLVLIVPRRTNTRNKIK